MPSYCDDIVDDNITEISNDSRESQIVDVESPLAHSLLTSSTVQRETCELIPNDHLIHLNDKDSHQHSLACDKKPISSLTSSSSTNSSSSSVLNYTIENLLSSSKKLSKPSSPSATAILQSTITGTAYITYPAYYDYRRLLPYSNVEQVWKYILPHHSHHNGHHHNSSNNLGPIRQNRGPRRQRTTFTHEQTLRLEMEYHVCDYISRGKRFQLADLLDLTENQIKIWFQNRRAKDKRIEKAIMEQQYRHITASNIPKQVNLSNCSTCSYTKHQFESSMVTNGSAQPVDCDGKKSSLVTVKHKLKIESSTDE